MNISEIKRIIANQREEQAEIMARGDLIERDIPDLRRYLAKPNILAILGVRRCGKSVLSNQLLSGTDPAYVNFDDERLIDLRPEHLEMLMEAIYEVYGGKIDHLLLDEIQNVPRWELFVNRLRRTKRVVITGSNANLLGSELATHLTGRYMDHVLLPFSFKEYLNLIDEDLKNTNTARGAAKAKSLIAQYIDAGGFPEATTISKNVLIKIYQDIILKDAVVRYGIRHRKTFSEIAKYLVSNHSSEFTYTKLKNVTGIKNVHTVKNYVDYLCSVYLIFVLEKFSPKLKVQMLSPKKVYCIDTGLAGMVGFSISENRGPLMENLVAVELLRRRLNSGASSELYYWQDQDSEVDFVLRTGQKVTELIQCTYEISDPSTLAREVKGLINASGELSCRNLKIISWDHEGTESKNGKKITIVPLYKWLLND